MVGADPELHQLAERIELFGDQLTCTDDANRLSPVLGLDTAEAGGHRVERVIPRDPNARCVPRGSQQRVFRTVRRVNGVVFRQSFRTQQAAVDGVIRDPTDADRFAIPDADVNAAPHGAVAAGRPHPSVGHALRGDVASGGIDFVRVALGPGVEPEHPLDVHAASLPAARYGAAMCLGTTLTKNR